MRTFFLMLYCILSAATVHAAQTCTTDSIPASTSDSQLTDNGDGTVTDSKTGLMWKKCLEGLSGTDCAAGSTDSFTWQAALQQPGTVNDAGGFAGHTDWRMPNIRELRSIVEEQCSNPAINATRFPNTPNSSVWSGSPYADFLGGAWSVYFDDGHSAIDYRDPGYSIDNRDSYDTVRLVRDGQ